jgi:AIPR protein
MITTNLEHLPNFLHSYGEMISHLYSQLEDYNTVVKGKTFANFVIKIVPLSDYGTEFDKLKLSDKISHDGGVDVISEDGEGCIQCKLTIKGVDEIDRIISKFENYYKQVCPPHQQTLESLLYEEDKTENLGISFMIVTLSDVKKVILPKYEKSSFSSKSFYLQLKGEGKIKILDGYDILPILQSSYRKMHVVASSITLNLDTIPLKKDNVFIAIVSAKEIKNKYLEFGEALFLENIRGFLGDSSGKKVVIPSRENVNEAIRQTAQEQPEKMLAKNNGITFRAKKVRRVNDSTLQLEEASIVNGCQTTMCLIDASRPEDAYILVKIVETEDSWDIAKSANFQNKVEQIELELARYVRPQVVKEAASKLGIHVENTYNSVFDVLESIYSDKVEYDDIYSLFVGIFSKTPNNVISINYTELRYNLLRDFASEPSRSDTTFEVLFMLYKAAQKARKLAEEKYNDSSYKRMFQRFWKENKSNYRTMLTILAACGCVRNNIYSKDKLISIYDIDKFLSNVQSILQNDEDIFVRYYRYAFQSIAMPILQVAKTPEEIVQSMNESLKRTVFDNLYAALCVTADTSEP